MRLVYNCTPANDKGESMESIGKVMQRITTIEHRFVKCAAQPISFDKVLAKHQEVPLSPGMTSNYSSHDVERMVRLSASKYAVDPNLAVAIAKAESNLSPEVVSSAGAVGVMQLMPETARNLGVRNINDPRENIDGGVRYLKQLLTSFNGDITKSVAAYNAGPAAVEIYNGIPPYRETQAYVAKVLENYR